MTSVCAAARAALLVADQGQNGLAVLGCVITIGYAAQGERASQAEATAEQKMKSYEQKKTVAEQADAYKKVGPIWYKRGLMGASSHLCQICRLFVLESC